MHKKENLTVYLAVCRIYVILKKELKREDRSVIMVIVSRISNLSCFFDIQFTAES